MASRSGQKFASTIIDRLRASRRSAHFREQTVKLPRRRFLGFAAGAAALQAVSRVAAAQSYPTRPVRLIVPYAPGGTTDITARLISPWLSQRLGQSFVIECRPGAATNIGTEVVATAAPDGYTLLLFDPSSAINATLFEKLNFNFIRDIAPIVRIMSTPFVIVVNPSVPAKTLPEFIAYAKANPGKINMASAGTGSASHLAGELFKVMAGVELIHIPYRGGGPAVANLLGGQVDVAFAPVSTAMQYIRANRLRALAVTGTTRFDTLPDVPTAGVFVTGYEASYWIGLGTPKKTSEEIVDTLNKEINVALATPEMQGRFAQQGGIVVGGSPAEFQKFMADETNKWGKVIRVVNIKPE
jgi:tripartite-type tricarboxylate transporter receptor subunit TctC